MGQRAGDYTVVPLCWECHQGPKGVHGDRSRLALRKKTEMGMLNDTIENVLRLRQAGALGTRGVLAEGGRGDLDLPGTPAGGRTPGRGDAASGDAADVMYAGEAWLRAAKHDWVRLTLHPEHLANGNPFEGPDVPQRFMLVAVPLEE